MNESGNFRSEIRENQAVRDDTLTSTSLIKGQLHISIKIAQSKTKTKYFSCTSTKKMLTINQLGKQTIEKIQK